jgi:cytochrome P450
MPSLERYGPYIPGVVGGYFREVQSWKNIAVDIVQRCRQRGAKTPFLRNVLNGQKDAYLDRPLTDSELAEECMGGMFGGSGTTANTFVYLLWACLHRRDVVSTLQAELREHCATKQVPDYQSVTALPYLQAVIKETLRRYPTIIATLPRTAREETIINDIRVPAGTIVGTQNYTIHRDPIAFPDAESFRPERWLDSEGSETRETAWTPFSVGSRKCVGIK